jgi:A/G-specific adenine glycosylase
MTSLPTGFAGRVMRWQQRHGRNGLPWQASRDPYRVWLSEVMLQQTQVATVLEYYPRFLARFPDVAALAAAPEDDVLGLWSGLGYYSRARNLHRCAREVMRAHGGEFPRSAQVLRTLPGIGRSTAAAIAAFSFGERAAILDGNVKRVLARVLGFDGDLASAAAERELWSHAEALLPQRNLAQTMPRYTQGLMDLGATLCTARDPACQQCPVRASCAGCAQGDPQRFPVRTRKLRRRAESLWLLHAQTAAGAVWLQRRPNTGIWAGLYCLPAFESREELQAALRVRCELRDGRPFLHVLTHRDLHLHPVQVRLSTRQAPDCDGAWVQAADWPSLGLPAPVRKLLATEAA